MSHESPPDWLLVVSAALSPGADVEKFNHWYDHIHLPDISACPGFHGGIRYAAVEGPQEERHFLALYRIDGPEALASDEFAARRGFGPFARHVRFTTRVYALHDPLPLETGS